MKKKKNILDYFSSPKKQMKTMDKFLSEFDANDAKKCALQKSFEIASKKPLEKRNAIYEQNNLQNVYARKFDEAREKAASKPISGNFQSLSRFLKNKNSQISTQSKLSDILKIRNTKSSHDDFTQKSLDKPKSPTPDKLDKSGFLVLNSLENNYMQNINSNFYSEPNPLPEKNAKKFETFSMQSNNSRKESHSAKINGDVSENCKIESEPDFPFKNVSKLQTNENIGKNGKVDNKKLNLHIFESKIKTSKNLSIQSNINAEDEDRYNTLDLSLSSDFYESNFSEKDLLSEKKITSGEKATAKNTKKENDVFQDSKKANGAISSCFNPFKTYKAEFNIRKSSKITNNFQNIDLDYINSFSKNNESERFPFLKTLFDANRNPIDSPNYDPSTLYISETDFDKLSNFEKQFWSIKKNYFDTVIFFKKGKFYELYENDADIGASFGLKITGRVNMRMAGVPEKSFEEWATKFLNEGYKIGRVDQCENSVAKKIREREEKHKKNTKQNNKEIENIDINSSISYKCDLNKSNADYSSGFDNENFHNEIDLTSGSFSEKSTGLYHENAKMNRDKIFEDNSYNFGNSLQSNPQNSEKDQNDPGISISAYEISTYKSETVDISTQQNSLPIIMNYDGIFDYDESESSDEDEEVGTAFKDIAIIERELKEIITPSTIYDQNRLTSLGVFLGVFKPVNDKYYCLLYDASINTAFYHIIKKSDVSNLFIQYKIVEIICNEKIDARVSTIKPDTKGSLYQFNEQIRNVLYSELNQNNNSHSSGKSFEEFGDQNAEFNEKNESVSSLDNATTTSQNIHATISHFIDCFLYLFNFMSHLKRRKVFHTLTIKKLSKTEKFMILDGTTVSNLELFSDVGLFKTINLCKTSQGQRMLKNWMLSPLMNQDTIMARQSAARIIEKLNNISIQAYLKLITDIQRITTKLFNFNPTVKDLKSFIENLTASITFVNAFENMLKMNFGDLNDLKNNINSKNTHQGTFDKNLSHNDTSKSSEFDIESEKLGLKYILDGLQKCPRLDNLLSAFNSCFSIENQEIVVHSKNHTIHAFINILYQSEIEIVKYFEREKKRIEKLNNITIRMKEYACKSINHTYDPMLNTAENLSEHNEMVCLKPTSTSKNDSVEISFKDVGKEIFQIEVPANFKMPSDFFLVSSTKDKKRYYTNDLKILINSYVENEEILLQKKNGILKNIIRKFKKFKEQYILLDDFVSQIDCLGSFSAYNSLHPEATYPIFIEHQKQIIKDKFKEKSNNSDSFWREIDFSTDLSVSNKNSKVSVEYQNNFIKPLCESRYEHLAQNVNQSAESNHTYTVQKEARNKCEELQKYANTNQSVEIPKGAQKEARNKCEELQKYAHTNQSVEIPKGAQKEASNKSEELQKYADTNQSVEILKGDEQFVTDSFFEFVNIKSPVYSHHIPNTLKMYKKIVVITGPNMGGKTTTMKTICLNMILAQMGMKVSATRFVSIIVDRIFSKLGTGDNLLEGKSTFQIELEDTARFLNESTENSFIIVDELGRGTSTKDGECIAKSVLNWLSKNDRCCLFSTHYTNILKQSYFEKIDNNTSDSSSNKVDFLYRDCNFMCVYLKCLIGQDLLFLYQIENGVCEESQAMQVARMAGIKPEILQKVSKYKELLLKK